MARECRLDRVPAGGGANSACQGGHPGDGRRG